MRRVQVTENRDIKKPVKWTEKMFECKTIKRKVPVIRGFKKDSSPMKFNFEKDNDER